MVTNGAQNIRDTMNIRSGVSYNEDWVSANGKHTTFTKSGSQYNHPSRMTKDELAQK